MEDAPRHARSHTALGVILSLVVAVEAASWWLPGVPVARAAGPAERSAGWLPWPVAQDVGTLGAYVEPGPRAMQFCDDEQRYHAHTTWVWVTWGRLEPTPDVFRWGWLDRVVQAAGSCGVQVALHVMSQSSWAVLPHPPGGTRAIPSTPPRHMADYTDFLEHLAAHYRGIVQRYFVEEEAIAPDVYFFGPPRRYVDMLSAASHAIHSVDPSAIVEDSGLSNEAVALLYAHHLYEEGGVGRAEGFLRRWFAHYRPKGGGGRGWKGGDLEQLFSSPGFRRTLRWTDLEWSLPADGYDVQQIHVFGPWRYLPAIVAWLHTAMTAHGVDRPVESWEFAYGWDGAPGNGYDPRAHARELPKLFVTAAAQGMGGLMQWQLTSHADIDGHPGLLNRDGSPRPAAAAFGVTSEKLFGLTAAVRLKLGPGTWCYRFDRPRGPLWVLWASAHRTIGVDTGTDTVTVTDIRGRVTWTDPRALRIGRSPIFVEEPEPDAPVDFLA